MFFSTGKVSHFVLSHLLWWYKSLVSQKNSWKKYHGRKLFLRVMEKLSSIFHIETEKKKPTVTSNHIHESTREITNLVFKIT